MIDFETEKNNNFKNFLKINDRLNACLFDEKEQMYPDVRYTLLNIAKFMESYTSNIFTNLTINDVIVSGSMGGYTYSDDSDIDLMVLLQTDEKIISAEEFDRQFKFLNSGLVGRGYKFEIKGHNVDYKWHTSFTPSSGIYSVQDDKWVSRPIKGKYPFTPEDFTAALLSLIKEKDEFMASLPRDEHGFLTMESCEKAENYHTSLRDDYNRRFANVPEKEYNLDFTVYRCFRYFRLHTNIMKEVTRSYSHNLSS